MAGILGPAVGGTLGGIAGGLKAGKYKEPEKPKEKKEDPKEKSAMINGFFDQLVKIAQGVAPAEIGADELRQMVPHSSMIPQRLSQVERAMPVGGTLAGAIGSGLAGGLSGLAAGKGARESMFRDRQLDAVKKIMAMRRQYEERAQ
jgi:hypothetical protein